MSKIAFFDLNRLSYEGGAENYIAEVGTVLAMKGHEVHYVGDFRSLLKLFPLIGVILRVISYESAKNAQKELENLPSMRKNTENIKKINLNLKHLIPFSREKKILKNFFNSCDIIFVKNEIIDMFFFFLLGRKFLSKTYLIIFTPLYYPCENDLRSKIHNFFYTGFFYNFFLRMYEGVIISHNFDLEFISKRFNYPFVQIHYIPHGIRTDKFKNLNFEKIDGKFRILFAGRLEKQKGIYYLTNLIDRLSQTAEFNQMEFTIVGRGPLDRIPTELSKKYKNVYYLGLIPNEDMVALYNNHDIVIEPSIWETCSYVCLEAQSCGIPVIAFDIPGLNEIIINGATGTLVPLGDLEKFKKEILDMFSMKKSNYYKFCQMKEKAREKISEKFSIEKVVRSLEGLL